MPVLWLFYGLFEFICIYIYIYIYIYGSTLTLIFPILTVNEKGK